MDTKELEMLAIMRPHLDKADGGYTCDLFPQCAVDAGKALLAAGAPDLRSATDEQAAFEEWARKRFLIGRTGYSPSGEEAWKAWQARAALASAAPVEALTEPVILDVYQQTFNAAPGRMREAPKSIPPMVIDFARAIEARIKGQPVGGAT